MNIYWKVLAINTGLTAAIVATISASRGEPIVSQALFVHVLIQLAIVTLIFAFRRSARSAVDDYLAALRSYLPRSQRNDITPELFENIHAQVRERETELGRPLEAAELKGMLDRYGHPWLAAGEYRHENRRSLTFGPRLIGPALFPFYLKSLIIPAITTALLAGASLAGGSITLPRILFPGVVQFVFLTLMFSVLERVLPKFPRAY